MADSKRLFLQHPNGDETTLPCGHLVPQHNGHIARVPCIHGLEQAHPDGDVINVIGIGEVTVPCVHLQPVHPEGDPLEVACAHLVPAHPEGHPGPTLPCVHPMPVVREEFDGQLKFYTEDELIQNATIDAVQRLSAAGVQLMTPVRPLQIFHRPALENGDGDDPFWSHYSPLFHSIQVIDNGQGAQNILETLRHEIGHALLGHTIVNHYAGGSHQIDQPADSYALAMSEGWAQFVGLMLTHSSSESQVQYKGLDWENLSIAPNGKVEYCVGAFLWDLFDTLSAQVIETRFGSFTVPNSDEAASFTFSQLYSVYAPDLVAVKYGPMVSSVWDFADRLKTKFEGMLPDVAFVDSILAKNCGSRPDDLPNYPFGPFRRQRVNLNSGQAMRVIKKPGRG